MKNKSTLLAIAALVVIVAVVGVIAFGGKKSDTTTSSTSDSSSMSGMDMSSSSSGSGKASDAVATNTVQIDNYSFSPQVIKVKVGDKVTWTNKDSVEHTVTADKASSDAPDSKLIAQGESYSFTFTKAGTYTYHCTPHPYMKATVIVE